MYLSIPILYELIFLAAIVTMALTSAIVLVPLHWLLRNWNSVWRKTILIHLVSTVAVFAVMGFLNHTQVLGFSGFLNGSPVLFCIPLAIADGIRVWRNRQVREGVTYRLGPWIVFLLIGALGVGAVRATANAPRAREALEQTRWSYPAARTLRSNVFIQQVGPVMQKAFPQEMEAIFLRYVAQARKENAGKPWRQVIMPKVPVGDFSNFIKTQQRNIAHAPDAELRRVAKTMSGLLNGFGSMQGDCSPAGVSSRSLTVERANEPADKATMRQVGEGFAAQILAARAGIDHPVRREISIPRATVLEAQFRDNLTPDLRQVYDSSPDSGVRRCEIIAARAEWIGTLNANDAVFVLSEFQIQQKP